jgi:succinate dehydrogenase / fumarate reductase membrane anchor subunit
MSLRTPMSRVLGLGAAKHGSEHWWSQRVTAIALLVLALWFVASLLRFPNFSLGLVTDWMAQPLNAVMLSLLVGTAAYHSQLGVQVVVEDYVHGKVKIVTLLLLNFIHFALAAIGIFSVLRIAFGVAA